ncbi:hypothetical protein ENU1_034720 [Entamoeba nuttalli P19]|uniref:Ras family GTPase n=1 Tax=Entamoeba nuttalli (strain P19) TaxID=1076696 RepID=K2H6D3_ENTNP|nr:hypothetical protein ENU1_034720 [Entamoeba nuttalli P19]EKE42047.1 hypothetical protein ENU1_034720 [Entamoeba nuttalli P19]|eukprot:XP_008855618.1 hypothetical protein ENU1_034720 [Entamoeba nuttalli P19]
MFKNNKFNSKLSRTIGLNEYQIHLFIDRIEREFTIIDSTGFQEHFNCIEFICKTCDFIIIFIDISVELNQSEIQEFIDKIERNKRISPFPSKIIVVGTKLDIKKIRMNKIDELEYIINSRYPYIEISSKLNQNCFDIFYLISSIESTQLQKKQTFCSLV